jgi:hypothetical protein
MIDADHIAGITHAIQLAIAPVFLLTAIGTIINAIAGRLARAVDRRRVIEDIINNREGEARENLEFELGILARRIVINTRAIALAVLSSLMVCILIGTAFAAAFIRLDLSRPVALLFIAAVVALTASLLLFMREVQLAAISVHPNVWPHLPPVERKKATAAPK